MSAITTKNEKASKASKSEKASKALSFLGKLREGCNLEKHIAAIPADSPLHSFQWVAIPGSELPNRNPGITTTVDFTSPEGLALIRDIWGEDGPTYGEEETHQRPQDKANRKKMRDAVLDAAWTHNHETAILYLGRDGNVSSHDCQHRAGAAMDSVAEFAKRGGKGNCPPMVITVVIHADADAFVTIDSGKSRNGRDVACTIGIPRLLAGDWSTAVGHLYSRIEGQGRRFGSAFVHRLNEAAEEFPGLLQHVADAFNLELSIKKASTRRNAKGTVVYEGFDGLLPPSQAFGGVGYAAAIGYLAAVADPNHPDRKLAYLADAEFDGKKLPIIGETHNAKPLVSLWEEFVGKLAWGEYDHTLRLTTKEESDDDTEFWTAVTDFHGPDSAVGERTLIGLDTVREMVDSVPADLAALRDKIDEGTARGVATKIGIDSRLWLLVKAFRTWVEKGTYPKMKNPTKEQLGLIGDKGGMTRLGGYDIAESASSDE